MKTVRSFAFAGSILLILLVVPIGATVVDSAAGGFTVRHVLDIDASPMEVYWRLLEVERWWSSDHTFSGNAAHLFLEARAGGIFGERLSQGGSVRHMEVIFVQPGRIIRLSGGLGPLQTLAVSGAMVWEVKGIEKSTRLEWTYTVGGYRPGGLQELAPVVDQVLRQQMERLKSLLETKK